MFIFTITASLSKLVFVHTSQYSTPDLKVAAVWRLHWFILIQDRLWTHQDIRVWHNRWIHNHEQPACTAATRPQHEPDTRTVETGDSIKSLRLPASCVSRAWWMQMRSSRIKAVRGHHSCQTPRSFTRRWSPIKKHVTFGLLVCGNFRTSSKGTVSRVLLRYRLRNVESDSTCCRRRLRGMSPSRVSAHLCSYFSHPAEFSGQNWRDGCVSRGRRHTRKHKNCVVPSMELVRCNYGRLLFFPPPLTPPPLSSQGWTYATRWQQTQRTLQPSCSDSRGDRILPHAVHPCGI